MNIAIIIAGGSGVRTHQDVPKQFLNVNNKPVIIYTLEAFNNHPDIDAIEVVCLDGWQEILKAYANQFNISKLKWITVGGKNGQESIRNGLLNIEKEVNSDDIVLIHDAVRPMVSSDIISDCIVKTRQLGNATSVIPCNEAVLLTDNQLNSNEQVPRHKILRTQTPQGFSYGFLLDLHKRALEKGITNSVASCTLMIEMGEKVNFSIGSEKNFKITTTDDLEIFKALLKAEKDEWLK